MMVKKNFFFPLHSDFRLYKPKYLALMLAAIWISGFGALVATWFGQWGRFGLDPVIGSCSILPDVHGRSPKEFLFILAFLTPCLAIVVCYARIFYIVRKTALRSRRNKVSKDLAKSTNLEVKYTKNQNFEDSAIGSSCVATMTTTENGTSPTRQEKLSFIGPNSQRLSSSYQNFRNSPDKLPYSLTSRKLLDNSCRRSSENSERINNHGNGSKYTGSLRNSSTNISGCKESYKKSFSKSQNEISTVNNDDKMMKENFHLSNNKTEDNKPDKMNVSNNNLTELENEKDFSTVKDSLQQEDEIPFMDSSLQSQNGELDASLQLNRSSSQSENGKVKLEAEMRPQIRFEEVFIETPSESQILNVESVEKLQNKNSCGRQPLRFEENSLQVPCRRYQQGGIQNSSESLLNSQISRYDEISEDFVSSRSDSPSTSTDKRTGNKKSNVFRRESRFKSMKSRQFETGKMTTKDKKLLKMILVIFASFLICYLPITLTKTFKDIIDWRGLNIAGYILIYLTTCINPIIYVVMSSEYRSAYKNVLLCRSDSVSGKPNPNQTTIQDKKKTSK